LFTCRYGHTDKDCPGYCRYCHEPGHDSELCPVKRCSLCREQGHRWQDCPKHLQEGASDGGALKLPWQLQAAVQHLGAARSDQHKGRQGAGLEKGGRPPRQVSGAQKGSARGKQEGRRGNMYDLLV